MKVTVQDEVKFDTFRDVEIGEIFRFTDNDDMYMRISDAGGFHVNSVNLHTGRLQTTSGDTNVILFDAELIAKQRRK